jgi:uncharacterized protein YidB (DUF937 family)
MGLFDDAVPGGNISKPLLIALGTLLVGKLFSGGSAPAPQAQPQGTQPQGTQPQGSGAAGAAPGGGLLGSLAGALGGGSAGGGVGGGIGAGLGGLLERFTQTGHGDVARSWVGTGPNQPIQPAQLNSALGQTTVSDLARQAGMSEEQLLAELSRVLPGVVDRLTPNGRVPPPAEIASVWNR